MMDSFGWSISRESEVFGQIGDQFNNPNLSDVTLKVGDQSYFVHRFVLAAQSSVFQSMLTDPSWKESNEKVIQLQESQEGEETFCDFLKFFYTGKLTLFSSNVCSLHMLADKYDVPLVKRDAETFMKEVLTGERGETLQSSLTWLAYIEPFIPDLLPTCYEAIQTNFYGLRLMKSCDLADKLAPRHLQEILKCPSSDKEIAVYSEMSLYSLLEKWAKSKFHNLSSQQANTELKAILPLIRFHNMNGKELQEVEESDISKAMGKSFVNDYIFRAHKVRSQRLTIGEEASNMSKKRRLSGVGDVEYKCPCDSAVAACPHLNPRFYFGANPFAICNWFNDISQKSMNPWDLGTLKTCVKVYTKCEEEADKGSWVVNWGGNYQSADDHINETFTIKPVAADIGRKYTLVVMVMGPNVLPNKKPKYRYAIKRTDVVNQFKEHSYYAEPILIESPRRPKSSWKINMEDYIWIGVSIHLHKP